MKTRIVRFLAFVPAFALLCPIVSAHAQAAAGSMENMHMGPQKPGEPMPSPPADTQANLGGKLVKIHYNSPRIRGRKIMGELVPYDKVWRTGANPATMFVTETNLKVGDLNVPAGKYTLYTLPEQGKPWMLIINKQTGQWGTVYDEKQDLGRTPMKQSTLSSPQENMSISLEKVSGRQAELHVRWENVDEWVPVVAQ